MLDVVFKGFISSSNHMLIAHRPLDGSLPRADHLEASPVTGLITLEDVLETVIQVQAYLCCQDATRDCWKVLCYHMLTSLPTPVCRASCLQMHTQAGMIANLKFARAAAFELQCQCRA